MLVARDSNLEPVGFVGIGRPGSDRALTTTPTTLIHRRERALVGVAEQLDLLRGGAVVVIVDDPLDAIAIETLSRAWGERWAGIPLCGSPNVGNARQESLSLSGHRHRHRRCGRR
jgi:hypothetical protein